jgi:hypothetical protein
LPATCRGVRLICFVNLGNSGSAGAVPVRRLPSYRRNPGTGDTNAEDTARVVTWPVNPSPGLRPSSPRPETVRESDPGNADSLPGSDRAGLRVCGRRCRLRGRSSGGQAARVKPYTRRSPRKGASPHVGCCAKEFSAIALHTTLRILVSESLVIYQEHFDADTNTSRTPERRWATYSRPRIGVRSPIGPVRRSPQTHRGSGPALFACETQPGELIGLRRSSTGSERVAGFGYRSPWWRVRGVQWPGVFEESLVPPAPDPRGTYPHLSLGSRRAPAELAHMYRYR